MFNLDNEQVKNLLSRVMTASIGDVFYGHRGRPGKRGGSVPRTEHGTKHENAQYEMEAGKGGTTIAKILHSAEEHEYTASEHKHMQDRSLVLVRGSDIEGSKFKGWQLYRYNKADRCLESNYGDNPKLYLKDLKGKQVRTFIPTKDTVNKDTINEVRRQRIRDASKYNVDEVSERLNNDATALDSAKVQREIRYYTGDGFVQINDFLRAQGNVNVHNGKIAEQEQEGMKKLVDGIETMSDAIGQSKLTEDTMLYRVHDSAGLYGQFQRLMEDKNIPPNAPIDDIMNAIVGEVGQEQGFMSSSYTEDLSRNVTHNGMIHATVHERIFAPKGTKALCVETASKFANEREVLVQRGTKMVVRKWWKDEYGAIYVEKEIVN